MLSGGFASGEHRWSMKTVTPVGLIIAALISLTSAEAASRGRPGGSGFSAPRGSMGGGARFSSPGRHFSGGAPRFSGGGPRFAGGAPGRGPRHIGPGPRFSSSGFHSSQRFRGPGRAPSNRAIINRSGFAPRMNQDRIVRSRGNQRIIASHEQSRVRSSARYSDRRNHVDGRRPANWHRNWDRRRHHRWNGRWWRYAGGYWLPFYAGYYPYANSSYLYDYYPGDYYTSSDQYSDSTVSAAQAQLASQGYYHGAIDGVLGPETRDAIRRYQRDHGLSASGVLTAATLQSLGVG